MNNVDLEELEKTKQEKLKKYDLDEESVKEFRKKIKKVSEEESNKLGKELFDLINSKSFNDSVQWSDVYKLVYKGANLDYKEEKKGDYPLLRCARKNFLKTFTILVRAGANINLKNNYLTTATMAAARHGNKEILEILILLDADINAKSKDGDNALISARNHHQDKCFFMLVRANAHLSVVSQSGTSIYTFKENEKFASPLLQTKLVENIDKVINKDDLINVLKEAEKEMLKLNPIKVQNQKELAWPTDEDYKKDEEDLESDIKKLIKDGYFLD